MSSIIGKTYGAIDTMYPLSGTTFGAFGAPAAATTGFGAAVSSQPSSNLFGANPAAPSTGTGLFGAQPGAAATSTAFGAPAATGAAFG